MHGSQMMYAIVFMIAQACDPALVGLFTPPRPTIGRYEVCTSSRALEALLGDGRGEGIHFGEVEAQEALDAFGSGGTYNRFALIRLYGGMRVRVARGWRQDGDRFESVTLLSPYPDVALTRLEPGTMTITLTLAVARRSRDLPYFFQLRRGPTPSAN
jgi:hypothetical protein